MIKLIAAFIVWAALCAAATIICSLSISFISMEWCWAFDGPVGRAVLVVVYTMIAFAIIKIWDEVE